MRYIQFIDTYKHITAYTENYNVFTEISTDIEYINNINFHAETDYLYMHFDSSWTKSS